jgi:hypothetical protein
MVEMTILYAYTCIPPSHSLPQSNQLKTLVAMEDHHFQYSYEQSGASVRGSIPSFSDKDFYGVVFNWPFST